MWGACGFAFALFALLAACSPVSAPSPAPTQILIPPTPMPAQLTATPLPAESLADDDSERPSVLIPAGAQALVRRAAQDLAGRISVNEAAIRLLELEAVNWAGDDLGCVTPSSQTPGDGASVRGYRLVLQAGGATYEYHTDSSERVRRCDAEDRRGQAGSTSEVGEGDPIAAELTALAQRRLADTLDLPLRRIHVVSVEPVTWTDTSLGCPQPDGQYAPATIDGYRLVLEAGETEYVFHSDFDRLIPCANESRPSPLTPLPNAALGEGSS